jgi:hypothetical protein
MTISKKDLQALNRDVKALGKKMEKLIAAFDKSQKSKPAKRVPAKKAPTIKASTKVSATDQVLSIIAGSKTGVNTAALMKETGFNQKKVWNILHRTYKQGKIKRAGKGIYVGA